MSMTNPEIIAGLVTSRTIIDNILKELVPEPGPGGGECRHEHTEDVGGAGGTTRKVCVDCKEEVG